MLDEASAIRKNGDVDEVGALAFVGGYQTDEALWGCTTCGACMEECPVMIEHVPAIIDMRRSLVMMESRLPDELQTTFRNIENNFAPWAFPHSERAAFDTRKAWIPT